MSIGSIVTLSELFNLSQFPLISNTDNSRIFLVACMVGLNMTRF